MVELQEEELRKMMSATDAHKSAVFFYTPLCGTCKIGAQMLEVVEATGSVIPIYKININYAPHFREAWHIQSVPCLAIVDKGELQQKEYAMRAVDYLFFMLKQ